MTFLFLVAAAALFWAFALFFIIRLIKGQNYILKSKLAQEELTIAGHTPALIQEVMRRFPEILTPFVRWTEISLDEKQWEEGRCRAEVVRKKFPKKPAGFVLGARALSGLGNRHEAEILIKAGFRQTGQSAGLSSVSAHVALAATDFAVAAERYANMRRLYPDHPDGYVGGVQALSALGNNLESEAVLRHAIDDRQILSSGSIVKKFAMYAQVRGDWLEAARRWELMRQAYPALIDGYILQSEALRKSGNWARAKTISDMAAVFFPGDSNVSAEMLLVASQNGAVDTGRS